MACFLVLLIVTAVYLPALGGPFLWDDRLLILESPLVEATASLGDYLIRPFWTETDYRAQSLSYYRPLVTYSFALDHRLHGSNSGGYHLTNLLFHLTNAALLFALLRRAGRAAWVAGLIALGWALLPRLAEAVAWISGRTDVIATTFAFGALLAWDRSLPRRLLSALLLFTGLLAKETAWAVLPALAAFEWRSTSRTSARLGGLLARLWPLLLAALAYLTLRGFMIGFPGEGRTLGIGGRSMAVLEASGNYALMLLDAWRPRAVIGRVGHATIGGMAAGAIALLCAGYGLVQLRNKLDERQWLAAVLALAALAPVLHVVPIPLRTLVADRFLYLPTAGVCLLLSPGLEALLGRRRPAWFAAGAIVVTLAVVTARRVAEWSDEITFWVETYLQTPSTNSAPATELVGVYYRAGRFEEALYLSERAARHHNPNFANYNAALCLTSLGRRTEALEKLRGLSAAGKKVPGRVRFQTALVKMQEGNFGEARQILQELAKENFPNAELLLRRAPELERASSELRALPATASPARRAELASFLGHEPAAIQAWNEVVRSEGVSERLLARALRFFLRTGDRRAIAETAELAARRGLLTPDIQAMVDVRLDELARLGEAWSRLRASEPPLP